METYHTRSYVSTPEMDAAMELMRAALRTLEQKNRRAVMRELTLWLDQLEENDVE